MSRSGKLLSVGSANMCIYLLQVKGSCRVAVLG
jgi:hypothetical protein